MAPRTVVLADSRRRAHATAGAILTCVASLGLQPLPAAAQTPDAFARSLVGFATAVEGPFGDEGPQVRAALDSMSRGLAEWDRALRDLEARAANPADTTPSGRARIHVDLARQYMARGRSDDAIRELETAARLHSGSEVHLLRGLAYDATDRRQEAQAAFRAAWEVNRANPVAAYWTLLRSGMRLSDADRRQALASLTAISEGALPSPARSQPFPVFRSGSYSDYEVPIALPAAYADGYARMAAGDYEDALNRFRATVAADPLLADPAHGLPSFAEGAAALRQGRAAVARDRLRAVVAARPESSEAYRILGVAYWANHEFDASIAALSEALRLRPKDERARMMLVRVLVEIQEPARARELLRQTIEALPQSTYAQVWLGTVSERLNRNLDAGRAYEAAARHVIAGRRRLYTTISQLYEGNGALDGVIDALSLSVRLVPNDAGTHNRLGRSYADRGGRDEALAEYSAALLIDPTSPDAYMGIGQLHLDAGEFGDAALVLHRLVGLQPTYVEARYALASALLRSGRTAEGNRELAEFQRLQAQRLEENRRGIALGVIKEEAMLRQSEGAFEPAIALWEQAVAREPRAASNHAALAAALTGAGRLEAAAQAYEKAATLGGPAEVFRQLSTIYERLGLPAEAERARERFEGALIPAARGAKPR